MTTRYWTTTLLCLTLFTQANANEFSDLATLQPGTVHADNALWIETPKDRQFSFNKQVVVADLKGPGTVTMIHFALPQMSIAKPKEYRLGRELVLLGPDVDDLEHVDHPDARGDDHEPGGRA